MGQRGGEARFLPAAVVQYIHALSHPPAHRITAMKPLVVAIIVLFAMDCALLYMNVSLRRDIRGQTSSDHANSSSAEAVQEKPETVIKPRDDQSSAKKMSRQTASSHGRRTHSMAETAIEVLIQRTVAEGVEAAKSGQDELHDFLQKTRPSTKQLFDMVRQENNRLAAINNEIHVDLSSVDAMGAGRKRNGRNRNAKNCAMTSLTISDKSIRKS